MQLEDIFQIHRKTSRGGFHIVTTFCHEQHNIMINQKLMRNPLSGLCPERRGYRIPQFSLLHLGKYTKKVRRNEKESPDRLENESSNSVVNKGKCWSRTSINLVLLN